VANACARANIPLATIHDSFATLPPYADRLNVILREELIRMYTEHDPLAEIHEYARSRVPKMPPFPHRGELDLRPILNSPYAFAP
jgi:DNA-directed RNA polymerase, mitochondrial